MKMNAGKRHLVESKPWRAGRLGRAGWAMKLNTGNGTWFIGLTFVAALMLAAVQAPTGVKWLDWVRPEWAVLLLFYWTVARPGRTSLVWAWAFALFLDVLLNTPLGLHGIGCVATVYLAARFQPQLALISLAQQAVIVGVLVSVVSLCGAGIMMLAQGQFVWASPLAGVGAGLAYPLLHRGLAPLATRWVRA